MVGGDKYHHVAARTRRHDPHIYTRLLRHGLLRAAMRGEGVSMPEPQFHRPRMLEVMEGKDGITIITELFGISVEDLKMNLEGDSLKIAAARFSQNVALPRPAKSIIMKSFKNGILELKLD